MSVAYARTPGTATRSSVGARRTCESQSSGAFRFRSGAFASRGRSLAFHRGVRERDHAGPACRSKRGEDDEAVDDAVEGAETETPETPETKDNPELKLLVDLIVEYPATRGTLAVLFG